MEAESSTSRVVEGRPSRVQGFKSRASEWFVALQDAFRPLNTICSSPEGIQLIKLIPTSIFVVVFVHWLLRMIAILVAVTSSVFLAVTLYPKVTCWLTNTYAFQEVESMTRKFINNRMRKTRSVVIQDS